MKNSNLSIFEFRRLPLVERQKYYELARGCLFDSPIDSATEMEAANLWAKDEAKKNRLKDNEC